MADTPDDEKPADGDDHGKKPAVEASEAAPPVSTLLHDPTVQRPSEWTASDARGPLETAVDGKGPSTLDEPAVAKTVDRGAAAPSVGVTRGSNATSPTRRRSLWPVAASIVLGALVGAGCAAVMYGPYGQSLLGRQASADPRIDQLASRVGALEQRLGAVAGVDDLKTTVADLAGKVAALRRNAASASSSGPPQATDLAPLERKVDALQSGVAALKAQNGDSKSLKDGLEGRVAALEDQLARARRESAATQTGLADVEGQQKLLADKVMAPALAVVADSLVRQIGQGQPYIAQVDALTTLGADPVRIAVLRQNADKGVPSAKTLAVKFAPLAEPIKASARKIPADAGFLDRLKSGMASLVSVRSVDDTSGDDLPSRVARIEADLAHDDVPDALATWDALPTDAKAKGESWSASAKTTAEAVTAARALQHDAVVALSAKKS